MSVIMQARGSLDEGKRLEVELGEGFELRRLLIGRPHLIHRARTVPAALTPHNLRDQSEDDPPRQLQPSSPRTRIADQIDDTESDG
jgi:hypothetical protein